jgi:hypothetical protein
MSKNTTTTTDARQRAGGAPKIDAYLLLALALSIFAIGPLMQPGYFWGAHDAKNSIYFLFEFDKSIQDGILWPNWGPDWGFGYGYPFWIIYGPLAYYVGEVFLLLSFNHVAAIKLVFALSILGSSAAMYLFIRRLLGSRAGLIAALVYVYAPYHLFDIYVRAALAESFSLVFVPLVFWAFFELVRRPRHGFLLLAAVSYAALILSSNVLLLMVTPALALMVVVLLLVDTVDRRSQAPHQLTMIASLRQLISKAIPPAAAFGLSVGLLAGFLLPAVMERRYVRLDQWFGGRYAFGQDFVHFFQLFSPQWGFGASIPGPDDTTGFQLGLVALVLAFFSLLLVRQLKSTLSRWCIITWQVFTLGIVYMMTPSSAWLWQAFPLLQSMQFPWRLGVLALFGLAVTAGVVVADDVWPKRSITASSTERAPVGTQSLAVIILSLLVLVGSYPYLQAEVRPPNENEGPVSLAALFRYQQSSDEMTGTTAWAKRVPVWSPLAEQVVQGGSIDTKISYSDAVAKEKLGVGSVEMDTVHELVWVYAADDQQKVTFMTAYFPGWKAYVYQDLGHDAGDLLDRVGSIVAEPTMETTPHEGWIVVPVPAGEHFLEIRFEDTPMRTVGKVISLLSLVLLLAVTAIWRKWPRKRAQ